MPSIPTITIFPRTPLQCAGDAGAQLHSQSAELSLCPRVLRSGGLGHHRRKPPKFTERGIRKRESRPEIKRA